MTFTWSKRPFFAGLAWAGLVHVLSAFTPIDLAMPWQPLSVVGIAVAFYLGFKNNHSYDRTWEARKIWGAIVNHSRSWGASVGGFVRGEGATELRRELVYRHLAWMTALRHQLRLSREWEHKKEHLKARFAPTICEDYYKRLDGELAPFLPREDIERYTSVTTATQILKDQSDRLRALRDAEHFDAFQHVQLQGLISSLYDDQGMAERIKNFPFPRQYASTALWLTLVFCALLPLGMADIFGAVDGWMQWSSVPLSAVMIWIFFLMEKIGDYSENPFEGTYNDVPITSIARGIEIDLREMVGDSDIPKPLVAENGFLL